MTSRLDEARDLLARAEAAASARASAAPEHTERPAASTRSTRSKRANPSQPAPEPEPDRDADPEAVARQIVLRQLTMAPRSRAQLEDKLRARQCPDDVAAAVLDRFTELGLIDDQAYAETLVRSRRETKGLARRALAHELRRKGVADDIVDDSLAEIDSADEADQARRLVDKRLRALHGLAPEVQTRRLAGMLARKGYSSGLAYQVIREALAESPEHRRD